MENLNERIDLINIEDETTRVYRLFDVGYRWSCVA